MHLPVSTDLSNDSVITNQHAESMLIRLAWHGSASWLASEDLLLNSHPANEEEETPLLYPPLQSARLAVVSASRRLQKKITKETCSDYLCNPGI